MIWEPGEEAWEAKLSALRSYRRATGHLAPRQDAVWGEGEAMVPIGQHMANLRRKGTKNGLGKDPERATERAKQLAAIDPDWDCPWPLDWQRHYRVLADIVEDEGSLPYLAPGVIWDGDDIGKWRCRQQEPATWKQLSTEQQERLIAIGMYAAAAPSPASAAGGAPKEAGKASQAFQRGLAALAQWVEREGIDRPVPRGHSETIAVDGETEPVIVRLGVWISNVRSRRDRLTADQLAALAALGIDWASPAPASAAQEVPAGPAGAAQPAPPKRLPQREHHDECDTALYEGGTCTCNLINELGPPSERDDHYLDNL